MAHPDEEVREQARVVASAPKEKRASEEQTLLRLLGAAMRREESSFDPAHGFARVMNATDAHHEVRLTTEGAWKIGSGTEEDLVETWTQPNRPHLVALLEAIPKTFSSARIGRLVTEVRAALT